MLNLPIQVHQNQHNGFGGVANTRNEDKKTYRVIHISYNTPFLCLGIKHILSLKNQFNLKSLTLISPFASISNCNVHSLYPKNYLLLNKFLK